MAGTWEEGVHRAPLFGLPTPEQWGSWRPATRTSMPAPSQAPTEVGASTTAHQEGLPAAAPKRWVAACFTFCSVPALPGAKSRAPLCRAVSRAVGAERTPPAPPPTLRFVPLAGAPVAPQPMSRFHEIFRCRERVQLVCARHSRHENQRRETF